MSKAAGESLQATARELRTRAREMFLQALGESSVAKAFDRHVHMERGILQVGDDLYDLTGISRLFVVSMGKAAHSMTEALLSQLGPGVSGIVVNSTDPHAQLFGFRYFNGGHPAPNAESLRAANSILRSLGSHTMRSLIIYLISGGASAMVEKPLENTITLDDLIATHKVLVHSGAGIREINAVRKHLSAVKGGRLAKAAGGARQVSILASDVPDGKLDVLASGPTMPDPSSVEECYDIVQRYKLAAEFPASVRELFRQRLLEETPKFDDEAFLQSRFCNILSNENARNSAVANAVLHGFAVEVDNTCDDWDYVKAADYLLNRIRELRRGVSRVCLISGGEVTVKVDRPAGTGGRNQQFALYCASKIRGEAMTVLSAGTDGIDGNSPAAGAIADGTTMDRAASAGLDAEAALRGFNAYPFFDQLGDAIVTGPTGNNIRDLRVLLAY